MKVLVTGGAGFVAKHLIRELSGSHHVVAVDLLAGSPLATESSILDIRSAEFINFCSLVQPELIIHLAGNQYTKPVPPRKRKEFFQSNIEMAESLAKVLRNSSTVQHVIYLSTDMVYGLPGKGIVYSDQKPRPIGPYGESKLRSEAILENAAKSSGAVLTIFRPRLINGAGRKGTIEQLAKLISRNLPVPVLGKGDNKYQMVSVNDVVSDIICASIRRKTGTFNLGSSNPPSVEDLIVSSIKFMRSRSRLIKLPLKPALVFLRFLDAVGLSPLSKEQFELAGLNYVLNTDNTTEILGWEASESDFEIMMAALKEMSDTIERGR